MKSKSILIWDWDGTLVDSLQYKYEDIWNEVFPDEPEKRARVQEFIRTPKGKSVNRYGLIQQVVAPEDDKKYVDRYGRAAMEQIERDGLFPRVREMLERLRRDGYSMYLVSGGGTDEDLKKMTESLGVGECFRGIFGFGAAGASLTSFGKDENFDRVMESEKEPDPSRYIVIGDGETDKTFAERVGAAFIGIANTWNAWRADGVSIVASAADVEDVLSAYQK